MSNKEILRRLLKLTKQRRMEWELDEEKWAAATIAKSKEGSVEIKLHFTFISKDPQDSKNTKDGPPNQGEQYTLLLNDSEEIRATNTMYDGYSPSKAIFSLLQKLWREIESSIEEEEIAQPIKNRIILRNFLIRKLR